MTSVEQEEAMAAAQVRYRATVRACFDATPEWKGKIMSPKKGGPFENYIPTSFSCTLIDYVGSMQLLRDHWEPEEIVPNPRRHQIGEAKQWDAK